jgi:hypothetical protein
MPVVEIVTAEVVTMKQTLQLRTTRHLSLTPQVQQSLTLLQYPALEFEQAIALAAANNPFLEHETLASGEDPSPVSAGDLGSDGELPGAEDDASAGASALGDSRPVAELDEDWVGRPRAATSERGSDSDIGEYTAAAGSLHDHLIEQIRTYRLSERDQFLAGVVAEALDEDGYLRQSLADIAIVIPSDIEATSEDLNVALRLVQSLDPAGVGARTRRSACRCSSADCGMTAARSPPALSAITCRASPRTTRSSLLADWGAARRSCARRARSSAHSTRTRALPSRRVTRASSRRTCSCADRAGAG